MSHRWFVRAVCVACGLGLASTSPARAEEEAPADVKPAPALAIEHVLAQETQDWTGLASRTRRADASGGGGTTIVVGGGATRPPFGGTFDAQVRAGTTVVASRAAVPGFALYATEERVVTRVTYEDEAFDLADLRRDVLALLDRARMRKWFAKVTWRLDEDGTRTWVAQVPRRFLPAPAATHPIMASKKNLAIRAVITLDDKNALASLRIEVDRDDPEAAMRARFLRGQTGFVMPGGGGTTPNDDGEDAAKVGETVSYDLRPRNTPAPRVVAAEKSIRADLDAANK